MNSILTVAGTLLLLVLVLYGAYLTSRYVARHGVRLTQSKNIRLVDRLALDRNRYLCIAQVGNRYFLVGIAANEMTLLAELRPEDILLSESGKEDKPGGFYDVLFSKMKIKEKK